MAVIVGSARSDENGKAYGGAAGDQTGRELSTQNWYAHSKGWVLLRAKSADVREKIACCMEKACASPLIGYDQWQRDSLFKAVEPVGFDVTRLEKAVECDCSALVRVCMAYAGIIVETFRTTDQVSVTMATGQFDRFTDDLHCKKSARLLRGDILVTKTQGHTVVVLSDGAEADKEAQNGVYALGDRLLARGMGGEDVKALQDVLMRLGYGLPKFGADGDFGAETENAVKAFQKDARLTVDGEFGKLTFAALMAAAEFIEQSEPVMIEVTGGTVRVRSGPGTQYDTLTYVHAGARFNATGECGGWHSIEVSDRVGWIGPSYTRVVSA